MPASDGAERQTRGKPRELAILSAVVGLLGEVGYEAMTMDAVAARAHASKTTIYRRWPGKAELVRAAADAYVADRALSAADAGGLRGDLLAVPAAMGSPATPPVPGASRRPSVDGVVLHRGCPAHGRRHPAHPRSRRDPAILGRCHRPGAGGRGPAHHPPP